MTKAEAIQILRSVKGMEVALISNPLVLEAAIKHGDDMPKCTPDDVYAAAGVTEELRQKILALLEAEQWDAAEALAKFE